MKRYAVFIEGVAGWIECFADSRAAAYAYAAETLGLIELPRRRCAVVVA